MNQIPACITTMIFVGVIASSHNLLINDYALLFAIILGVSLCTVCTISDPLKHSLTYNIIPIALFVVFIGIPFYIFYGKAFVLILYSTTLLPFIGVRKLREFWLTKT